METEYNEPHLERESRSMDERLPYLDSRVGPQWESGPSAGDRRRCRVVGQCHQGKTGLQTGQDQEGGCILQKAQENVFLLTPIFLTGF